MYGAVGDIYSGTVHYAILHACCLQVLPVADKGHYRVLPAAREAVFGPAHACRIEYLAGIRVLVPGPELLDPERGHVHGLGNMAGGSSFRFWAMIHFTLDSSGSFITRILRPSICFHSLAYLSRIRASSFPARETLTLLFRRFISSDRK